MCPNPPGRSLLTRDRRPKSPSPWSLSPIFIDLRRLGSDIYRLFVRSFPSVERVPPLVRPQGLPRVSGRTGSGPGSLPPNPRLGCLRRFRGDRHRRSRVATHPSGSQPDSPAPDLGTPVTVKVRAETVGARGEETPFLRPRLRVRRGAVDARLDRTHPHTSPATGNSARRGEERSPGRVSGTQTVAVPEKDSLL